MNVVLNKLLQDNFQFYNRITWNFKENSSCGANAFILVDFALKVAEIGKVKFKNKKNLRYLKIRYWLFIYSFLRTHILCCLLDLRSTFVCVSEGKKCSFFSENLACFVFLKHRFEICPFALLPTCWEVFSLCKAAEYLWSLIILHIYIWHWGRSINRLLQQASLQKIIDSTTSC